ncbi:hypothetical protein [Streptomyces coffeae]|uniref:Uncharacterized protein n=1 Tax=Streptomyces coffeae TaxID=621382 RepID=A0ABS1NPG1_9ACTN|nr:hypothetical protein [Streptomyces coffeae]MBL1101919.1 hypothetical protein [Streptomyces coffeae]
MDDTMRAIVITESLTGGQLPPGLAPLEDRRYRHMLDESTPIEIIELTVPTDRAPAAGLQLAQALLPKLYYAHLIDSQQMLVAFPQALVLIVRGGQQAAERAQAVGALFGIPPEQMRFLEMFDEDHPDAPSSARGRGGAER